MNFDPFVFVQVLIGFAVGLAPAIWLLGKNRTLERYVAALEKQADEVFFNQLHVERLVYKSSEGYFFKDHFVNFEEQLFYKQFPLTDRQPRKLPIGQNVDIAPCYLSLKRQARWQCSLSPLR